ncbi:12012_t:CDS:1, partial [Racocetra persica]
MVSPMINSSTDPQTMSMLPLELGPPLVNSTTDLQRPMSLFEPGDDSY